MNNEQKKKLYKYLFPSDSIQKFMCNDFFQELKTIIPNDFCISAGNIDSTTRENNLKKVSILICKFIEDNNTYKNIILSLFNELDYQSLINEFIIGYLFFITNTETKFKDIDIFKDKRSIVYSKISIADFI